MTVWTTSTERRVDPVFTRQAVLARHDARWPLDLHAAALPQSDHHTAIDFGSTNVSIATVIANCNGFYKKKI